MWLHLITAQQLLNLSTGTKILIAREKRDHFIIIHTTPGLKFFGGAPTLLFRGTQTECEERLQVFSVALGASKKEENSFYFKGVPVAF